MQHIRFYMYKNIKVWKIWIVGKTNVFLNDQR